MVAYVPSSSSRPSKVAPRRHWSTMQGLLVHSRQLHQVLKNVEREEERCLRLRSPRPMPSVQQAVAPQAKPLVFRKTKREIQRERELAEKKKNLELETLQLCQENGGELVRQFDTLRSTILASCKRLTSAGLTSSQRRRLSCRTQYLRRTSGTSIGLSRRCPPRRRLLF